MIVRQVLVYVNGSRKASSYCILRDGWKKIENRFGLSTHFEKHLHYTQASSIESVNLPWLVGVARPLWRGVRLEKLVRST